MENFILCAVQSVNDHLKGKGVYLTFHQQAQIFVAGELVQNNTVIEGLNISLLSLCRWYHGGGRR